ncbi:unnamed protein product [Moneuplotes crassus]|uniref:Uncharacterized protein n=1 Tax=Euplotes crassus TaxID=5936 RepID=A0AAD1XB16_EUPCR|nr:unnamed protein product [Moneuplotes crassus]
MDSTIEEFDSNIDRHINKDIEDMEMYFDDQLYINSSKKASMIKNLNFGTLRLDNLRMTTDKVIFLNLLHSHTELTILCFIMMKTIQSVFRPDILIGFLELISRSQEK